VARAEAYLHAKFHLHPSNGLATVHQHHRQDRTDRQIGKIGDTTETNTKCSNFYSIHRTAKSYISRNSSFWMVKLRMHQRQISSCPVNIIDRRLTIIFLSTIHLPHLQSEYHCHQPPVMCTSNVLLKIARVK